MSPHLVLVADQASARLYRVVRANGGAALLMSVDNPAARGHERDLGADRPGRVTAGGTRRHAYGETQSLRDHALDSFATSIALMVSTAMLDEPGAQLTVAAGPEMLGLLRPHLGRLGERTFGEWPHNLCRLAETELQHQLRTITTN